jgi:hypothetical protein
MANSVLVRKLVVEATLKKRLAEVQAAQPTLSDAEAYSLIFKRDPDLYNDYRRAVSIHSVSE